MGQKLLKVISMLLVVTILYANSAAVISYAADSLLTSTELEAQKTATNNSNVEFDVYYDDKTHTKSVNAEDTDTKLNMDLNVKNAGYLKNITVDFSDSNFNIADDGVNSEYVQKFDSENKKITFNQINAGSNVIKSVKISMDKADTVSENVVNKDNNIKLTATYVDSNGKEVAISKTIVVHTGWKTESAKASLTYETTKYIPYSTKGANKVIVQGQITSGLEKNILPIKETKIEITAPQINNEYPESVTITGNTVATNGDETGTNFTENNWSYDKTTGEISIDVTNTAVNGKISWEKDVLDQYTVTYIYSEKAYTAVKDSSAVRITYDVNSKITLYNDGTGNTNLTASTNGYDDQTQALGNIVDFSVSTETSLNKGYMYTNKVTANANKKETVYNVAYAVDVSYAQLVDKLTIEQAVDTFSTSEGSTSGTSSSNSSSTESSTTVGGTNYAYDKKLAISVKTFEKVLGTEGTITIKDKTTGKTINTITKTTSTQSGTELESAGAITEGQSTSENYYVVDLTSANTNSITIETTKPVAEGSLVFIINKAIAKDIDYSANQIKNFKTIKTGITGKAYNEDVEIASIESQKEIALEEPTQKATITSNKESLSTIVENKDVEISATLETDSVDDTLYTNPTVTINLPSNIESINITDAKLYFDDELKLKEATLTDNDDGTKTIVATIEGTQTKYNNVVAKGATLKITADITLNKLTPTTKTQIGLVVENGDTSKTTTENSYAITYLAPTGVVTTNAIANYKENSEELMSISGEEQEALIARKADSRESTFTMNVINNYDYDLSNVVVLGRMPFEGNKDALANTDLGSSMTLTPTKAITVSGIDSSKVKVYYSLNGEATNDLSLAANAWTTSTQDLSKVKSYMIVISDYTMSQGDSFQFTYNAEIPEQLGYNKSAYENYVVYFDDAKTTGESATATKIGVTTGNGPEINASLASDQDSTIKSGNILKYTLTVNNTGKEAATGLKLTMPVNSSFAYVEEDASNKNGYKTVSAITTETEEDGTSQTVLTLDLDDVPAKSSITKNIWLLTSTSTSSEISYTAQAKVANEEISAQTNTISKTVARTYFETSLYNNTTDVTVGETFNITMFVQSTETDLSSLLPEGTEYTYTGERKNTTISFELPSELSIDKVTKTMGTGDEEDITESATVKNSLATINLGGVTGNTQKIKVTLKANDLSGTYQKEVTISPKITADGVDESEQIGTTKVTINKVGIEVTQTSSIPENTKIATGEQFEYTITVKNLSNTDLLNVKVTDSLPTELIYSGIEMQVDDGNITTRAELDENNKLTTSIALLSNKSTATIKIKVVASKQDADKTITNKAVISYDSLGEISSNEVTNTIKAYGSNDDIVKPEEVTRKITGTIWIDKNQDGTKDTSEAKVQDVEVLLLDNSTGDVAVDSNSEKLITKTDSKGEYGFSNVKQGKYTVIFFYDSANYSPTTYQKEGVNTENNSDAIDKDVVYEGTTRRAGVTEEITVSTENIYNIDLGLIEDKKFDLKLNKTVSKITLNTSSQSKVTEYNSNLAKIDIASKDANDTTMIVEYKITITNEGAIPGYAKKIADYLPDNMKFNSELNRDWYTGKDTNTIYNSSLSNTLINPGESKEVTLTLTARVTDDTFGMVTNNAEIYEASNDYGLEDVDSTAGNKKTDEDDYSTANIIVGVKTGQVYVYITLGITIVAIIGTGVYMIKKRVLK